MRSFQPIHPPGTFDPALVNILKNLNNYLLQTSAGFKRIERGETPSAGGALFPIPIDHHNLSSLTDGDDHPMYLFLGTASTLRAGKASTATTDETDANKQIVYGNVSFRAGLSGVAMQEFKSSQALGALDGFSIKKNGGYRVFFFHPSIATGDIAVRFPVTFTTSDIMVLEATSNTLSKKTLTTQNILTFDGTATYCQIQNAGGASVYLDPSTVTGAKTLVIKDWSGTIVAPVGTGTSGFVLLSQGASQPIWSAQSGIDHGSLGGLSDDDHPGYLWLAGRSGGQIIGAGSHSGGSNTSLVIEGSMLLGDNQDSQAYISGQALNIRQQAVNVASLQMFDSTLNMGNLSSLSASPAITAWQMSASGDITASSGSFSFVGFNWLPSFRIPTGVTGTTVHGGNIRTSVDMVSAGAGQLSLYRGLQIHLLGPTKVMAGAGSEMTILDLAFTPGAATWTNIFGLNIRIGNSQFTGTATTHTGLQVSNNYLSGATITTHIGLRVLAPNVTPSSASWGALIEGTTLTNRIEGKLHVGSVVLPLDLLSIGAGTTTVAPLRLISGTSRTTPAAGCIEFTTDDLFFTITTGVARKAFILDDGARLTSGKIPVATTNGRLINLTASAAYTPTNETTDRAYDANATTLDELSDVVGTMIADLQTKGILG